MGYGPGPPKVRLDQGEAQALPQDTACILAADSVIAPCLTCSWTGTQASRRAAGAAGAAGVTSATRYLAPGFSTRRGPQERRYTGHVAARHGHDVCRASSQLEDRLVSIPLTVDTAPGRARLERRSRLERFPQRQNLARLGAAVGVLVY